MRDNFGFRISNFGFEDPVRTGSRIEWMEIPNSEFRIPNSASW